MNSLLMTILAPLVIVATLCAGKAMMCVTRHDRQPASAVPTRVAMLEFEHPRVMHRAEWN